MKAAGKFVKVAAGLWINQSEAVMVLVSGRGAVTKEIQPDAGILPGRDEDSVLSVLSGGRYSGFSGRRLERYYDEVVASIGEAGSVLIFGPGKAKKELIKRIERGNPCVRVVGVETSDRMTDRQIAAEVRKHFRK